MFPSVITFQISFCIFLLDYSCMQTTNDAISLQNATCSSGKFTCGSGHCIDELKLCDGTADCGDNSDETIEVCNSEQCPDLSFMCEYGACIHMNGRCNGFRDCFDWSDEESCEYTKSHDYFGCELPDNPPHGEYAVISHLWDEYHPGDVIPTYDVLSLSCHKGYVINPPEDDGLSYCLPIHEWMPVPKTCVRMSLFSAGCRLPNNPSNGKYVVINHVSAGYKPGDIVPVFSILAVNCDNGYAGNPLEYHRVSYCLPTEEWSPTINTCKVRPILSESCRIPNNPSYGRYSIESALGLSSWLQSELTSGDMVPVHTQLSLKCFKGHEVNPSDDELSNCTSTGDWSPVPKTCVYPHLECQVPTNPLHGKYVVINHSSNSDEDYVEEDVEKNNDEYITGDFVPVHSLLSLKCNKGYEVNPSTDDEQSNCTSTGKWVPSPKTCFQGCPLPDNPLNGKYVVKYDDDEHDEYYPGDFVPMHRSLFVNCNKGFQVIPSTDDESSNCTSTGKWVSSPKSCFQGCPLPDNPLNGKYVVENDQTDDDKYRLGDIVSVGRSLSVHCNEGYEVSPSADNALSICTSTGKWVPPLKTCFQGCRFPDNPLNGKYLVQVYATDEDKYYPGDIVPEDSLLFVICNQGYNLRPPTNNDPSFCTSTGKWNPAPKICLPSSFVIQGCRVPSSPSHGKYIITSNLSSEHNPGDIAPVESVLSVNCKMGYAESSPNIASLSRCELSGKWIPEPKLCARACPSLISTITTNVVCEFDGKPLNTCTNAVENTIARLSCAPFYEESNLEKYPARSCNDGNWKYPIPQCYPICGINNSSSIINNIYRNRIRFEIWNPWDVNIYKKVYDFVELEYTLCRGSIITERIVLSAARCFADDQGKKYVKEDFFIAAAKTRNSFNDPRDINAQYSRIHAIHIHESFKGIINYYKADIAIIILSTPFQLTANVQPVCIDLETVNNETSNDYDKFTELGTDKMEEQIYSILPYNKCSEKVDEEYRKYITDDKICFQYTDSNFTVICVRPSGSALTYLETSTDRYFVRFIASTEFKSNASLCHVAYTLIDPHIDFINLNALFNPMKSLHGFG